VITTILSPHPSLSPAKSELATPRTKNAWHNNAERLADWLMGRVFVRRDSFGGYYRKDGQTQKTKRPNKGSVEPLSRELLIRHARATLPEHVLGGYGVTPGVGGVGRWVAADIDAHDDTDDPEQNLRYAIHLYHKLVSLGFTPLLVTWGSGGYHLWVLFREDVLGLTLYEFGLWLVADAKQFGFKKAIETFPKQGEVPTGKFGNWLRAPGRHHTRDVFASVYNGSEWVEDEAAVERILSIAGDDPGLIPALPKATTADESRTAGSASWSGKPVGYTRPGGTDGRADVFAEYNRSVTLDEVVEWHKARRHCVIGRSVDRVDFARAGKKEATESFNVKLIDGVPITWCFSNNAGLPDSRGLNPSQMRCFYQYGRFDTSAMRDFAVVLRRELGWDERPAVKSTSPSDGVHESRPVAQAANEPSQAADATTAAGIITQYFIQRYRPDFRRGNSIHTGDGEIVPMGVACEVPTSKLIEQLAGACDAPRFANGSVKRDSLPGLFRKWGKVAWGDLLELLPDEDTASLATTSLAADEFRRLVREAMLSEIVVGDTIGRQDVVTRTERRSLIDWCVKWAKTGPWRTIRSKKCWCKVEELGAGEIRLKVAIRHELFAQIKADRRIIEMGANTFTRRAAKYEVGTCPCDDRPHGQRAVILTDDFVSDLTEGLGVDDEEDGVEEFDHLGNGQAAA